MIWPARWSWVVLPLLALACVAAPAGTRAVQLSPQPVPTLVLRLGYNGVVVTAQTPEPQNKLDPPPRQTAVRSASGTHAGGFSCPKSVVLVAPTPDVNGNQFCVTASTDALSIAFASPAVLPYASQKTVTCTQLRGASANPALSSALVRIGRGTHLTFEQTRVNDEVWLPSRTSIQGDARLGYLLKMHADQEITYRDYKKFQSDSRIVTDEKPPE